MRHKGRYKEGDKGLIPEFKVTVIKSKQLFTPLSVYWAVQPGLLTPLTFAQHHLSPLPAFTSGAYFLQNGRW